MYVLFNLFFPSTYAPGCTTGAPSLGGWCWWVVLVGGVGGWRCWVVLVGGLVSIDKCHRCVGSCLPQPVHGDSSHSSLKPDIEGVHQPAVAILILLPTQELATR